MAMTNPGTSVPMEAAAVRPAVADVSQRTLDATPRRAFEFIKGVSTDNMIREQLSTCGFEAADIERGWELVLGCSGYKQNAAPIATDMAARSAIVEIDNSDERIFRIATVSLEKRYPVQAAFLFDGIGPVRGAGATINMTHLLNRLDQLESGAGRDAATRTDDLAAVALLAKRGLHKEERARLAKLLEITRNAMPGSSIASSTAAQKQKMQENLIALRDWFVEWSEIARTVITRRDQLIRIGLGQRRSSDDGEEEIEPAAPTQPAPVVPVAAPAGSAAKPQ